MATENTGTDQTAWGASQLSALSCAGITPKERDIVRELARQVAEIAARPIEREKTELWYRHNALERVRPLIFCDPENGWNEIFPPSSLECQSPLAREWEMRLKKEIFWGTQMRDDRVIEPYFNIGPAASETDWGVSQKYVGGENCGAYTWEAPVKDLDDLSALRFPSITVDQKATEEKLDLAREVLGDFLEVREKGAWWWSIGMTYPLVNLRGLEQMMWDMIDNPKGLHSLMAFLRDGHLAKLDYLELNGLLYANNRGEYVGSGGFGWTKELPQPDFAGSVRTMDMWGFCESQETVSVSPDMFEEFVFQYQLPIMERFGLNCYGCCEPLDKRWEVVKKAPRLRRVSVSPWNDLRKMGENLQDRYIYSMKPNPAHLAAPSFDEGLIRSVIREILDAADGCVLEFIMKDNHTIGGDPNRVIRWVEIVREEIGA